MVMCLIAVYRFIIIFPIKRSNAFYIRSHLFYVAGATLNLPHNLGQIPAFVFARFVATDGIPGRAFLATGKGTISSFDASKSGMLRLKISSGLIKHSKGPSSSKWTHFKNTVKLVIPQWWALTR